MVDKIFPKTEKEEDKEEGQPQPVQYRRRNRRSGDNDGGTASTWLISFTDVMALMLTFFVLLFAMSSPDKAQWEKLAQTAQENFNRFQGRPLNRGAQDAINIDKVNFSRALDLNYLQAIVVNIIEQDDSLSRVSMMLNGDNLIISLPQDLLFDAGQAQVKEQGNKALFSLAGTLSRIKNRIEVVGHTDPRPVSGGKFPSNWELSLARAANVAAVLENVGYGRAITIRGHASARYYDLPVTLPNSERLDLSRRVDIVVMEDDGKRLQLFDLGLPNIF